MIYIFDITRILLRSHFPHPTGIDRVDTKYLYFLLSTEERVIFCKSSFSKKGFSIVQPEDAFPILENVFTNWEICDSLYKNPVNPLSCVNFVTGNLEEIIKALPDENFVYLNFAHMNPVGFGNFELETLACYKNLRIIFYIYDIIPIDFPEFCLINSSSFKGFIEHVAKVSDLVFTDSIYAKETLKNFISSNNIVSTTRIENLYIGLHDYFLDLFKLNKEGRVNYIKKLENLKGYNREKTNFFDLEEYKKTGFFLYVATIEARKNHFFLFSLWKKLSEKLGDETPKLIFIGKKGWLNQDVLHALKVTKGLSNKIIWLQDATDIDMLKIMCSEFCLGTLNPSFVEGYGMPAAESASLGLPTVCSTCEAYAEATQGQGIYLDPNSMDEWLKAVMEILESRKKQFKNRLNNDNYQPILWSTSFNRFKELTLSLFDKDVPESKLIEMRWLVRRRLDSRLPAIVGLEVKNKNSNAELQENRIKERRFFRFSRLFFGYAGKWLFVKFPAVYSVVVFPRNFYRRVGLLWDQSK